MIDVFYTPDSLARSMVKSLPKGFCPSRIVDFAAGEGSLLETASTLWPNASVYANDVCPRSARRLRAQGPQWFVSCVDFLSERSRNKSKFGQLAGSFDLVLLNPPFSQRGVKPTSWPGMPAITSGQAALFVYIALGYLAPSGYLLAILPDGCLSSRRDRKGWMALADAYDIEVISSNPTNSFKGVSARTSIVRIRKRSEPTLADPTADARTQRPATTQVIRGTNQMHSLKRNRGGVPLIHTSELREGVVTQPQHRITTEKTIRGPALLFPRVGRVTTQKLCLLEDSREVALSDCVLGVLCETTVEAEQLRSEIIKAWPKFAEGYRGTGAPYITVERATSVLDNIQRGISSVVGRDSSVTHEWCPQSL
ncbi:N-6 DNA methylase [Paraburkholderia aspalathi]|uniref:DNA methylase adenine-specific domain-containing protein n=1 Tax=Paraburkholderia nemoris TaxID=2793076 RepID=A0ABM8SKC2_9BURK|nr:MULTISPECIES: N-6 DNA methylase [Paraburkholderia]MBK3814262.1 N-6 DNA methylase [Paraburkholderia aspalathi]CAE6816150.1 hypothetical protein R69776_05919 [Paraburkholderia nemoris]